MTARSRPHKVLTNLYEARPARFGDIIIIVYYAEASENIKHTHTIHAYTIKQFKHTNKNTYYVKSMR